MFRFTIRDVLWLTVVVALAVGWWVDRWHLQGEGEVRSANIRSQAEKTQASLRAARNNERLRESMVSYSSNPQSDETDKRRIGYRRVQVGEPVAWEWADRPIPK